jgi:thioredoxin 1
MVQNLIKSDFEKEVLQSTTPVLIDFWAEWCGPCRQLAPVLDDVAKDLSGKVKICKVNVDQEPELAGSLAIRGIPTLILFKDGKQIATKVGSLPKASLISWIEGEIA